MKQETIQIRVSEEEKLEIERKAKEFGFASVSEYLRYVGKMCKEIVITVKGEQNASK